MGTRNPGDYLSLYMDPFVKKHIMPTEEILFSDLIIKTNRKGRPQDRVLLITSAAVYNLVSVPTGRALKRRIDIRLITKITVSNISNEFVIHVPSEYDYRISSSRKLEIIHIMINTAARLSLHNTGLTSSKGSNILSTSYANGMTPRLIDVVTTDAIDLGNVTRLRTGGGGGGPSSSSSSSSSSSASMAYLQTPLLSSSASSGNPFGLSTMDPYTKYMHPTNSPYISSTSAVTPAYPYPSAALTVPAYTNSYLSPTTKTTTTTSNNNLIATNNYYTTNNTYNDDDDSDNENISFRALPYQAQQPPLLPTTTYPHPNPYSHPSSLLYSPSAASSSTLSAYRSPPLPSTSALPPQPQQPLLHGSIFMNNLPVDHNHNNNNHPTTTTMVHANHPPVQSFSSPYSSNTHTVPPTAASLYSSKTMHNHNQPSSTSSSSVYPPQSSSRATLDFDDNDENTSPWLRGNGYPQTKTTTTPATTNNHPPSSHPPPSSSASSPQPSPSSPPVTGWSKPESVVGLHDFELLRVIGRGSYGKVFLVRKIDTKEVLAMKVLHKAVVIARNQIEHTQAERAILESIDHPFLCHLRYAFQTKTKLYLVLPYLRGGEVFHHLKKQKRFSEPLAKFYIAEIVLGLGHLHAVGIVYRDLKPENILLDSEGHVCLTDFGLAKVLTQPTDTANTFCGTPEYLAPEVIEGYPHDKGVDWWSLGILLWEMLTGLPPFYNANVQIMYEAIRRAELHFPTLISPTAQSLLRALLTKHPNDRLGNRPQDNDAEAVKQHPFFDGIDWTALYERRIPPPWKPVTVSSSDVSNFDQEFTSEPVLDSVTNPVPGLRSTTQEKEKDKTHNYTNVSTTTKKTTKNGDYVPSSDRQGNTLSTEEDENEDDDNTSNHHHHHYSGQDDQLHLSSPLTNTTTGNPKGTPLHPTNEDGDTNDSSVVPPGGGGSSSSSNNHEHPVSSTGSSSFHAPHFEGFSYAAQHSGALHGSPTAVSL